MSNDHQPITGQDLKEMKRRCDLRTPNPFSIELDEDEDCVVARWPSKAPTRDDVRFFAHATADLPRCLAEIERLTAALERSVAENTAIRREVAKVMVALDKGEINMSMDLMNEFYRILGFTPPYPTHP